ncbi:hypothetical protein ICW40_04255 [Actinotalea ferrariae]|uniref:hypothetical protein n=1 Tax=Actinotalea ferrariae TaxID=1386098 RepID=UPI001C8CDF3E|nr:hypothetical protein [Actinotalea ferrariae]MBX9244020.1 hypothetical protein [Actinotalea ferrariae]
MGHGFEVDWDVLGAAGSRLLRVADDVPTLTAGLSGAGSYGHAVLAASARGLTEALGHQQLRLGRALEGLGDGLRDSARNYSDADAGAAVNRVEMYLR